MRSSTTLVGCILLVFSLIANAAEKEIQPTSEQITVVDKKLAKEEAIERNPFAISFYKQNFAMPFYYTGSPYNKVYTANIPPNQRIKNIEIKYQLSFKVPVWKEIFGSKNSIYFGYTQLSYWQAYNKNAFFRETDYQPEVFFMRDLGIRIGQNWELSTISIGAAHESNGFGNELERSWNRIYLEAVLSNNQWMITVKPWYVIKDSTYKKFNPDLVNYLGYGELSVAYKFAHQVLTLQTHSLIEQGGRRATGIVTYTFPLTRHFNGFVQGFTGYGQSLIEYNHHTNSIGVGISLNNLV